MTPKRRSTSQPPLKPVIYLVLASLADGDSHGYAIRSAVEDLSGGSIRLDPGTLYRHISRLMEDGLLEESAERPEPSADDARRRYYRLTELGRRAVAAEAERMARLVDDARARNLMSGSHPA